MNRTRWIATAAAALVVVLGGGAALAATGASNPASDFLGGVAKRLGISQDKLEGAIQDEMIARIDAAVAAGEITEKEGDAMKDRVRSGDLPPILPSFRGPAPPLGPLPPSERGVFPAGPPFADFMETAADYLGMDAAELKKALGAGKSLADLAKDRGKSVDGLGNAIRDEIREDADRAVEDGVLTKEQADRLVEKFGNAVDKLVEGNLADGFEFDFRDGDGKFGLRFRIGPDGPMPRPKRPPDSSFDPSMVPAQPI